MKRTDHLFFDLGDTLVDLKGLVPAMEAELKRDFPGLGGKHRTAAIQWVVRTAEGTRQAHTAAFRPGIDIAATAISEALSMAGREIEFDTARSLVRRCWTSYLRAPKFCDDVTNDLLMSLRKRVKTLGLVTDSDDSMVRPLLARLGLESLFDVVVVSETVRAYKPDAAIYREALRRSTGDPETSQFVSDSELDLRGAASIGMGTILICRSRSPDQGLLPPGSAVLSDLRDLPKLLAT